jgi:hypothetical protein
LAFHGAEVDVCSIAKRLRLMQESARLESLHNARNDLSVFNISRSYLVSTLDDLVPTNLDQRDSLGVARLEAYRGASRNVESVAMCPDAIELQLRVRLDEVVVRANLIALLVQPRPCEMLCVPELVCPPCS